MMPSVFRGNKTAQSILFWNLRQGHTSQFCHHPKGLEEQILRSKWRWTPWCAREERNAYCQYARMQAQQEIGTNFRAPGEFSNILDAEIITTLDTATKTGKEINQKLAEAVTEKEIEEQRQNYAQWRSTLQLFSALTQWALLVYVSIFFAMVHTTLWTHVQWGWACMMWMVALQIWRIISHTCSTIKFVALCLRTISYSFHLLCASIFCKVMGRSILRMAVPHFWPSNWWH